jgi:hypothetical protein
MNMNITTSQLNRFVPSGDYDLYAGMTEEEVRGSIQKLCEYQSWEISEAELAALVCAIISHNSKYGC